jgi:Ca2+-binding RTX toxin-like protein
MNGSMYTGLGAIIAMSLFSHSAMAACPGVFSGKSCNGTSGGDVCTMNSAASISCDLAKGLVISYDTESYYVTPSNTTFRAYGYEGDGQAFCCEFSGLNNGCDSQPIDITIDGTDYDDEIRLVDNIAGENLDCSTTTVHGLPGADTIIGSPSTDKFDFLHGDGDSDYIRGLTGGDTITGGYGDDYLYGDDGIDKINGGWGVDHIKGGALADEIVGEGGEDYLCGGSGADTIDGGDNDDEIYGEAGTDSIEGGTAGETDGDTCENDSPSNCEHTVPLNSTCPW